MPTCLVTRRIPGSAGAASGTTGTSRPQFVAKTVARDQLSDPSPRRRCTTMDADPSSTKSASPSAPTIASSVRARVAPLVDLAGEPTHRLLGFSTCLLTGRDDLPKVVATLRDGVNPGIDGDAERAAGQLLDAASGALPSRRGTRHGADDTPFAPRLMPRSPQRDQQQEHRAWSGWWGGWGSNPRPDGL